MRLGGAFVHASQDCDVVAKPQQLLHRIVGEPIGVVGVRIPTGDAEHALGHQRRERVRQDPQRWQSRR